MRPRRVGRNAREQEPKELEHFLKTELADVITKHNQHSAGAAAPAWCAFPAPFL